MKVCFASGEISFDTKPPSDVLSALKHAGYRWSPGRSLWYPARRGAFTASLSEWLSSRMSGPRLSPCWSCKAPEGRMRNYGAASPVYCDPCNEREHAKRFTVYTRDPGEDSADRWSEAHP